MSHDPFHPGGGPFVAVPGHVEAVARLCHAVATAERQLTLTAEAGLGKSRILDFALGQLRSPERRIARLHCPPDAGTLCLDLARALGASPHGSAGTWRTLARTVRSFRLIGQAVVLALDDCHALADRDAIERLCGLDPDGRLTVVRVGRPTDATTEPAPWELAVRLVPLSRDETARYLAEKLTAAGRTEPVFTEQAVTRLHALARGNPRGLDRLASLALRAGAVHGLRNATPEVVEGAFAECHAPG